MRRNLKEKFFFVFSFYVDLEEEIFIFMETLNKMNIDNIIASGTSVTFAVLGAVITTGVEVVKDVEPFLPQTLNEWASLGAYFISISAGVYTFIKKRASKSA